MGTLAAWGDHGLLSLPLITSSSHFRSGCLPLEAFSDWDICLLFPQRARQVPMGRAAASAASAGTVALVTLPRGSALAPQGGQGWPASRVSTGASAALTNGLWRKPAPSWTWFPSEAGGAVRCAPTSAVMGFAFRAVGVWVVFHCVPPPRVCPGTARARLPAAL